jgi:hypothetical protein
MHCDKTKFSQTLSASEGKIAMERFGEVKVLTTDVSDKALSLVGVNPLWNKQN